MDWLLPLLHFEDSVQLMIICDERPHRQDWKIAIKQATFPVTTLEQSLSIACSWLFDSRSDQFG